MSAVAPLIYRKMQHQYQQQTRLYAYLCHERNKHDTTNLIVVKALLYCVLLLQKIRIPSSYVLQKIHMSAVAPLIYMIPLIP